MRVAVLGGGYAGLTAARRLEESLPESVDLCVIDDTGTHLVQHELHRVIRRPALADELTIPLDSVLDRADVIESHVESVDAEAGTVDLGSETIEYDAGLVALGAQAAFYDLPGIEEYATPLKRVAHALAIRDDVTSVLESGGRIVVAGAGLSGIQVAGEITAMRDEWERAGDSEGDSGGESAAHSAADSDADVVLLEQRESVAPTFPPRFQKTVREALEEREVDVRTGTAVTGADEESVTLATDETVAYDELVWTGGIRGPDATGGDRPQVRSDLRLAGDTFVAGDAARVVDDRGQAVPAAARTAIGQARVAATNVARVVEAREDANTSSSSFSPRLDRYVDSDPGWIVSVGDGAVAQVGGTVLTGRAALALKTSVGAGYLSRVGAVRRAVDLVRSELGIAIEGEDDTG